MSEKLEVIFLGTGGGVPTTRRFLPAVALRRGGDWFLFDAGEGVQMRLRQSPLGWGGLQAILISHLHGDHVLGLPGLLMSLGMARMESPLAIYGPPGLQGLIQGVMSACHVQLPFPVQVNVIPAAGGMLFRAGDVVVEAFPVKHRVPCYGFTWREDQRPGRFHLDRARELGIPTGPLYRQLQNGNPIQLEDGRQIQPEEVMGPPRPGRVVIYCTDTTPSPAAIQHSQGADLLIHDSTFSAEHEEEARVSGHSTAAQAAAVAQAAHCRQLALTHISSRYQDDQILLEEALALFPHTFLAADLLQVEVAIREE